jgi:SAM-dependent methyltransferase
MSNLTKKDFAVISSLVGTMSAQYSKLGAKEDLELELRIPNMSREVFNTLYQKLTEVKHVGKIEQSIMAIAQQKGELRTVKRMEMYFNNGVRMKERDKYIEKTTIDRYPKGKPVEYIVKLAKEKQISGINPTEISEYRLRLRSSLVINDPEYPEFANWRFDFTFTKMLSKKDNANDIQRLPEIRDEFFRTGKRIDVNSFMEFEPSGAGIEYELEIEWVPDDAIRRSMMGKAATTGKIKSLVDNIEQLVPVAMGLVDPTYYEQLGYHQVLLETVEKMLPKREALDYKNRKTLKNFVNRPKSFTKSEWETDIAPEIDKYFVSDKADGERAFLVMGSEFGGNADNPNCLLITADRVIRLVDVVASSDYQKQLTVCDVEIMDLHEGSHGDIYLFDVLIYKGKDISGDGLEKRETHLDFISQALGEKVHKKILQRLDAREYRDKIRKIWSRKDRKYDIDGLIFTQADAPYRSMNTWKWKPAEELTIDFLVMRVPTNLVGIKPNAPPAGHTAFWLFSGVYARDLSGLGIELLKGWNDVFTAKEFPNLFSGTSSIKPVQFTVPSDPYAYVYHHPDVGSDVSADALHGHVGEFKWIDGAFALKTMRPDKDVEVKNGTSYGNAYKVAFDTFMVIKNPVTIEDLTRGVAGAGAGVGAEQQYFQNQKQEMYKPAVKFNNFVVAQLLRMCEDADWIVDLAAGRGSHLFVYNGFGVKNGLFVDSDKNAIEELTKRTEMFGDRKLYLFAQRPHKNMKVYTKVVDLSDSAKQVLTGIREGSMLPAHGANVVVSTFAIHYFVGRANGPGSINNLVDIVDDLLKPGGIFIFTCFSGSRVRELLGSDDRWEREEGGIVKYSIKRARSSANRISVLHPFSAGAYYDEYLVDVDEVVGVFEKRGFAIMQNGSFSDWLKKFQQFNAHVFDDMSEDDRTYTGLYQYVSMWKRI